MSLKGFTDIQMDFVYISHAVGKADKQLYINPSPIMKGSLLEFSHISER